MLSYPNHRSGDRDAVRISAALLNVLDMVKYLEKDETKNYPPI
ncbi:MAG: hypothetical protein ACYDHX_12190 [Methanothrix sp.]